MSNRRERLIVEVTERLSRVCGDWPPGEFADLVLRVVDTTVKYEGNGPAMGARARSSARDRDADVQ